MSIQDTKVRLIETHMDENMPTALNSNENAIERMTSTMEKDEEEKEAFNDLYEFKSKNSSSVQKLQPEESQMVMIDLTSQQMTASDKQR